MDTAIILALVGAEGALSFGILWLGLGARWTRVRLAALGLGVLALSAVFLAFPHGPPAHFFIVFLLSNIAWLVASLVVFRLCGFRLIWRRAVWL